MTHPEEPGTPPDVTEPTPAAEPTPSAAPRSAAKLWAFAIVGAILAGLASWGHGEHSTSHFKHILIKPGNWNKLDMYEKANYESEDALRLKPIYEGKNIFLTLGVLGIGMGLLLGLAGGLWRGSLGGGITSGLAGAFAGAALLAGAIVGALPWFYKNVDPEMSLMIPVATHLALFAAVGAAGGLALGLGMGTGRNAMLGLIGGVVGAMIGAVVFDLAMSLAFSNVRVFDPIPKEPGERVPRLLLHACAALFTVVFALLMVRPAEVPAAKPRPQA